MFAPGTSGPQYFPEFVILWDGDSIIPHVLNVFFHFLQFPFTFSWNIGVYLKLGLRLTCLLTFSLLLLLTSLLTFLLKFHWHFCWHFHWHFYGHFHWHSFIDIFIHILTDMLIDMLIGRWGGRFGRWRRAVGIEKGEVRKRVVCISVASWVEHTTKQHALSWWCATVRVKLSISTFPRSPRAGQQTKEELHPKPPGANVSFTLITCHPHIIYKNRSIPTMFRVIIVRTSCRQTSGLISEKLYGIVSAWEGRAKHLFEDAIGFRLT